jgi:hypothetical protein
MKRAVHWSGFPGVEASLHALPMPYSRYDSKSFAEVLQWYQVSSGGFHLPRRPGYWLEFRAVAKSNDPERCEMEAASHP